MRLLPLSLALLVAVPAAAQNAADTPEPDGGAAPVTPASAVDTSDREPFATMDEDQSIYVVQKRTYSKSGKFEVSPIFFTSLNNKFVGHMGAGVVAAYHLRENFAVELASSIPYLMWSYYSALVKDVYFYETLTPEVVDLKQMDYWGALGLQYSALYGKFELYGALIGYDFYASAGFGMASTREPCVANRDGCSAAVDSDTDHPLSFGLRTPAATGDRFKLAGNLAGGMRFFFQDWAGLRLEIRDVAYADRAEDIGEVTTDIQNNVLFILGFTLLL